MPDRGAKKSRKNKRPVRTRGGTAPPISSTDGQVGAMTRVAAALEAQTEQLSLSLLRLETMVEGEHVFGAVRALVARPPEMGLLRDVGLALSASLVNLLLRNNYGGPSSLEGLKGKPKQHQGGDAFLRTGSMKEIFMPIEAGDSGRHMAFGKVWSTEVDEKVICALLALLPSVLTAAEELRKAAQEPQASAAVSRRGPKASKRDGHASAGGGPRDRDIDAPAAASLSALQLGDGESLSGEVLGALLSRDGCAMLAVVLLRLLLLRVSVVLQHTSSTTDSDKAESRSSGATTIARLAMTLRAGCCPALEEECPAQQGAAPDDESAWIINIFYAVECMARSTADVRVSGCCLEVLAPLARGRALQRRLSHLALTLASSVFAEAAPVPRLRSNLAGRRPVSASTSYVSLDAVVCPGGDPLLPSLSHFVYHCPAYASFLERQQSERACRGAAEIFDTAVSTCDASSFPLAPGMSGDAYEQWGVQRKGGGHAVDAFSALYTRWWVAEDGLVDASSCQRVAGVTLLLFHSLQLFHLKTTAAAVGVGAAPLPPEMSFLTPEVAETVYTIALSSIPAMLVASEPRVPSAEAQAQLPHGAPYVDVQRSLACLRSSMSALLELLEVGAGVAALSRLSPTIVRVCRGVAEALELAIVRCIQWRARQSVSGEGGDSGCGAAATAATDMDPEEEDDAGDWGAVEHLAALLGWANDTGDLMLRVATAVQDDVVRRKVKVPRSTLRALPTVANAATRLKARVAKTASTNAVRLPPPVDMFLSVAATADDEGVGALEGGKRVKRNAPGKRTSCAAAAAAVTVAAVAAADRAMDWTSFVRRHWDSAQKNAMLSFSHDRREALAVAPDAESARVIATDSGGRRGRSEGPSRDSTEDMNGLERPKVFGLDWEVVDADVGQERTGESAFMATGEDSDTDDDDGAGGWGLYSYEQRDGGTGGTSVGSAVGAVGDSGESSFDEDEFSDLEDDSDASGDAAIVEDAFDYDDGLYGYGGGPRKRTRAR